MRIYHSNEIEEMLRDALENAEWIKTRRKKKAEYLLNVPCAFDIETTSFLVNDEPRATMYEWTLGINDRIMIGRTWEEFKNVLEQISKCLNLNSKNRIVIYVHNLAFEFQWIRKYFNWTEVFALDTRKPVRAITTSGIEFRCSYILSALNLATVGKNLTKYKAQKMSGDLDYSKIRHSKTPLTDKELGYCINDVKVVMNYIRECIETEGDISKIPLTNTGYVRRYVKNNCFYIPGKSHKESKNKTFHYHNMISNLRLSVDEYEQAKRAFQGGYTHASPWWSGRIGYHIGSIDFTSSYPAVLIAEQFPMSSCELIQITSNEEFKRNLKLYNCMFDIEFEDIESTFIYDSYIASSRCWSIKGSVNQNGRIVSAKHLCMTITEQDYDIISRTYKWKKKAIRNFRRYRKGYLPKDIIESIVKLYEDKTKLKGVEGMEAEYLRSKGMLNSVY